jgi:hypothetical protein
VDSILQGARDNDGRSVERVGQSKVIGGKFVIVVLDIRRPVRSERLTKACAGGLARLGHGCSGIDGKPQRWGRESNVGIFTGPGDAASGVNQSTTNETITEAPGNRRQEVIADRELRGSNHARGTVRYLAGSIAIQAGPGNSPLNPHDPGRCKLIIAADLSATDDTCGAKVTRSPCLIIAEGSASTKTDKATSPTELLRRNRSLYRSSDWRVSGKCATRGQNNDRCCEKSFQHHVSFPLQIP